MSNTIITITGPSCSGKTTLTNQLLATEEFSEVISTTTRPPRTGEVNGVTYHFVTPEEFKTVELLERVDFNGNLYGGSVAEFEKQFASGRIPLIIVEPNGMGQVNKNAKEKGWKVINVFVACPPKVQAERFLGRFREEVINQANGSDPDDLGKLMREYVNRMVTMQTTEAEWFGLFTVFCVDSSSILIDEFTKENEKEVLEMVRFECISLDRNG